MKHMTIKKWMFIFILPLAGFLAAPAYALDFESFWDDDEYQSLLIEGILDNEGGNGSPELAGQIGFGIGRGPLDEMGILVGHLDGDGGDLTTAAIWFEENFTSGSPFVPYVGTDIGYGYLNHNGPNDDADTLFFRVNFGVKYFLQKNMALKASFKAAWSVGDIYLIDHDEPDDKDYGIGLGLHYYY